MTFYFSGAGVYCLFLILRMFQDRECDKTDFKSWIVIVLASLLWIVVIPISVLEMRTKIKVKNSDNKAENSDNTASIDRLKDNNPVTEY